MAPKRGPSYSIELRKDRNGRYYLKLILDDDFDGRISPEMDWYEHDKVRVFVRECHDDGYDGDGEENSHTPTSYAARRTTVFCFNLSDAVND